MFCSVWLLQGRRAQYLLNIAQFTFSLGTFKKQYVKEPEELS